MEQKSLGQIAFENFHNIKKGTFLGKYNWNNNSIETKKNWEETAVKVINEFFKRSLNNLNN